ncbi:hypothetical protein SRHO_G00313490 [Serrasalmus rhombeus]
MWRRNEIGYTHLALGLAGGYRAFSTWDGRRASARGPPESTYERRHKHEEASVQIKSEPQLRGQFTIVTRLRAACRR